MSLQPTQPNISSSSAVGRYRTASELLADRRAERGSFKRGILEEKLSQFGGGINTGSIRSRATDALKRIIQQKAAVRRTVPKRAPSPSVVVSRSAPIERIVEAPRGGPQGGPRGVPRGVPTPRIDPIDKVIKTGPEVKAVSLWKDLTKGIGAGVSAGVAQRVQSKIAGPAIATAVRAAPAVIGRILQSPVAGAGAAGFALGGLFGGDGGAGAAGVCPVGFHLNKARNRVTGAPARSYCVRNRRMNVGNSRAARRSVRRLKGARKLLQDIEKMMPRRTVRSRAPHHHHPAAGG